MKFLPANKITAFLVAALVALCVPNAKSTISGLPIGNTNTVIFYCLGKLNAIDIYVYQNTTNGYVTVGTYPSSSMPIKPLGCTNKAQLDTLFHEGLGQAVQGALTNTSPYLDRSKPFQIFATAEDLRTDFSVNFFSVNGSSFTLVKSNGSYYLPDMSNINLVMENWIPFEITNLWWARIESYQVGQSYPYDIEDPRLDPDPYSTGIYESESAAWPYNPGLIYLNKVFITSGTNSSIWQKITVVSGTNDDYQIFNNAGEKMRETAFKLEINEDQTNVIVTVNGGDSGRGFAVQSSTDLTNWTDCSPTVFVPTNAPPHLVPKLFVYPFTNGARFFRTATTNVPPS